MRVRHSLFVTFGIAIAAVMSSARAQGQMFMTLPYNDSGISITSGWLYDDGSAHHGIDYAIGSPPESFPVVSTAAGNAVVVLDDGGKSNKSGYGNFVYVEHDQFDPSGLRYFTVYAHLRSGSWPSSFKAKTIAQLRTDIENNNFVDWAPVFAGDQVGSSGDTGHSFGIHLHFEPQRGGYPGGPYNSIKTDPYDIYNIRTFYPAPCQPQSPVQDDPGTLWTQCPPVLPSGSSNPVPTISALVPPSLFIGSSPQALSISGSGFLSASTVTFNGIPHNATLNQGTLSIQLSAADLADTGYFPVVVTNPPPGGGASNTVNFIVGNPVPAITALVPPSLPAGSPPQPLTINGAGFVSSSTVTYNGQPRTTAFVSSTELTIQLTSTDLANPGSYPVYVTDPGPLGGTSNTVDFVVSGQSEVTISPTTVTVPEAGLQTFSATVSIGGGITWSVQEGSTGGTISSTGIYTPPNSTGVFHVIATSTQDPSQYAVAAVTVIPALNYSVIYSFSTNSGYFPQAGVIQLSDTSLWGTTTYGGAYQGDCITIGCGTVYELDSEHNFAVIHAFAGTDGAFPEAPLLQTSGGNLFGTTLGGGANGISWACAVGPVQGCGTIFEIDTAGSFSLSVYFHGDQPAGSLPQAGLLQSQDGYLYGTTTGGGCPFQGAVFRSDSLGNIANVHCFTGQEGSDSTASLIQGSDSFFYGTTTGLAVNNGTVFKVNSAGNLTVLHTFSGTDGATPTAALMQGADGAFYGTTAAGGTGGSGTIFRIGQDGSFVSLHSFTGPDGAGTLGYYTYISALIEGNDGFFYGATLAGGASNVGTVFRMDGEGNVTILHSFNGTDGLGPLAGVIQGTDGYLYGTTSGGGTGGGVIYQIPTPGNQRRH